MRTQCVRLSDWPPALGPGVSDLCKMKEKQRGSVPKVYLPGGIRHHNLPAAPNYSSLYRWERRFSEMGCSSSIQHARDSTRFTRDPCLQDGVVESVPVEESRKAAEPKTELGVLPTAHKLQSSVLKVPQFDCPIIAHPPAAQRRARTLIE